MDDLLQEFIAETRETLEALSGEIVAWEAAPSDRARLDAIFRFVHTVKGSCGFLDLPRLTRLSHAAEDVLAAVRSGDRFPDARLVNAVLAIVDRIGEIVEAIDSGAALDDSGEDQLIAALEPDAAIDAPAAPAPTGARAVQRSVRLSTDLLDRIMSGMSDMVLARNDLARRMRDHSADPTVEAALDRLSATVAELRDTVTRTRMQKVDALFSSIPRMVRDAGVELGKHVRVVIEGADVELDREMIEMMRDPLVHIIRNAIDHGIEAPEARIAAGKQPTGRLTVSARQSGNQIIIEIADDGRGIDTDALVRKLARSGAGGRDLSALSERARLDLIFEPGLTTKEEVTAISGRGVGMDVVRANIEQIGGRIELVNAPGRGLRLLIHVPLTLSIIPAIVMGTAGQQFAITRQAIEEIVDVCGEAIRIDRLGDTVVATVRGRRLPLVNLAMLLGLRAKDPMTAGMLVIVSAAGGSFAIAVDTVLDHEELVIKPSAPAVMATGLYAGQTLPDSGSPMLLLDCSGIADVAGINFARDTTAEDMPDDRAESAGVEAFLFDDLDGRRRAVPLAIVDRVETVAAGAAQLSGGRMRLLIDGRLVPLEALGDIGERARIGVLRMKDGDAEVAYAIADPVDIVMLPAEIAPAAAPGPIMGVVTMAGEQIELLDPQWLFSGDVATPSNDAPLCVIDGGEAWVATFLKPLLETAGYRVATRAAPGERPAIVLTTATLDRGDDDGRTVYLSNERSASVGVPTVYRYDRAAVLAAVAERVALPTNERARVA